MTFRDCGFCIYLCLGVGGLGLLGILTLPEMIDEQQRVVTQVKENQKLLFMETATLDTPLTVHSGPIAISNWLEPYLALQEDCVSMRVPLVSGGFLLYPNRPDATTVLNPPAPGCVPIPQLISYMQQVLQYNPTEIPSWYQLLDAENKSDASTSNLDYVYRQEKNTLETFHVEHVLSWVTMILFWGILLIVLICLGTCYWNDHRTKSQPTKTTMVELNDLN